MINFKKYFLALAVFLMSFSAYSFNTNFLTYSPVSYFTQEDLQIYMKAAKYALNNVYDRQPYAWSNPKTDAHGYFIPNHSIRRNGMICRNLYIYTIARKVPASSEFTLCRCGSGWKVVS